MLTLSCGKSIYTYRKCMNTKERFFIIGGMGYIGSVFAREALRRGHDVCIYDSLIYEQKRERILHEIKEFHQNSAELQFIIGDTRNTALLESSLRDFQPTYVMHWGELSSVYACDHYPAYTEDINYNGSRNVIDICEKLNLKVFWNSSSSVYGVMKEMKCMTEADELPTPTDNYCKYKLQMESYIKEKVKRNPDFHIIIFRPATVFGISPRFRIELMPNHFTYLAVARWLIRVSELNAYRAVMDVEELVQGYFKVIDRGSWQRLIYNIGHFNMSKMQLALGVQNVVRCKIGPAPDFGDIRNLQIDCSLFDNEFDFHPTMTYEESIARVADWIEKNYVALEKSNFVELLNMPLDRWHKICS